MTAEHPPVGITEAILADAVARIAGAFPDLAGAPVEPMPEQGWDFRTFLVGGAWVFRFPRFPDSAAALRVEVALLPAIAAAVPVRVPEPELVAPDVAFAGYRYIEGGKVGEDADVEIARALGSAVSALHSMDTAPAIALGMGSGYRPDDRPQLERLRDLVLPHLPTDLRAEGAGLIDELLAAPAVRGVVRHTDLGADHVLIRDGALVAIIDWGDLSVGDPAIDLCWALCGRDRAFADAFAEGYGSIEPATRRRAALRWAFSPWHDVAYGLRVGLASFVTRGLAEIGPRLSGVR